MAEYKIGTLSDQGWISDPMTMLNYIMSCYMLTDAAQSYTFQNELISLPFTYQLYINDPDKMANAVSSDLSSLLNRYFTHSDVVCTSKALSNNHYAILLKAVVIDENNIRYDLSKIMELDNNDFRKIIEINNYGDGEAILATL